MHAPPVVPTFGDLTHAWLEEREEQLACGELALNTLRSYRRTVRQILLPDLGELSVAEVSLADLRRMHAAHVERPVAANQAIDLARRILAEAEELGFRPRGSNPTQRIRRHPELASTRPASPDAVSRAWQACAEVRAGRSLICHPTMAALFQLVAVTGARPTEIRTLQWPQVRWGEPTVLVLDRHKTVRRIGEKKIPLDALGEGVLRSLEQAPVPWVFPSHVDATKPYKNVGRAWRRLADEAGLGRTCLRDLRSGLATTAYDQGVPIEQVKDLLGHSSLVTTLRYTKISAGRIAESRARVSAAVFSSKGGRHAK